MPLGENTLHELDDILNASETDADRWTAFLKQKTAARPQNNPQFVLGGSDISFDVKVDLIKLSAKDTKSDKRQNNSRASNGQNVILESQPQHELLKLPESTNLSSQRAVTVSHSRQDADSLSKSLDPSVRVRCVDIRLLSQETLDINATLDGSVRHFLPALSSTPTAVKQAERLPKEHSAQKLTSQENVERVKEAETRELAIIAKGKGANAKEAGTTQDAEKAGAAGVGPLEVVKTANVAGTSELTETAEVEDTTEGHGPTEVLPVLLANDVFERSYLATLMQLEGKGNLPLALANRKTLHQSPTCELISTKTTSRIRKEPEESGNQSGGILNSHQTIRPVKVRLQRLKKAKTVSKTKALTTSQPSAHVPAELEVVLDEDINVESILSKDSQAHVETTENSKQLLDLHVSRSNGLIRKNAARSVLNKPTGLAINGEAFAQELMQLEHIEILDLRKRNSVGLFYNADGLTKISNEQQLDIEKRIESELLRRRTSDGDDTLTQFQPLKTVVDKSNESMLPRTTVPRVDQSLQKGRRSRMRSKRREKPMSEELQSYLRLSETIEMRLKSRSSTMSKRSLYTKGHSDLEDNLTQSPTTKRPCYREIQIAPAPPMDAVNNENDDIFVVPPPPASMRYSQVMANNREEQAVGLDGVNEMVVQQEEVQELDEDVQQTNVQKDELHQQEQQKQIKEKVVSKKVHKVMGKLQTKVHKEGKRGKKVQQDEGHKKVQSINLETNVQEESLIARSPAKEQSESIALQLPQSDSVQMESLRMGTPTPPLSVTVNRLSPNEEPSTSKAAREALELSVNSQQTVTSSPKNQRKRKKIIKANASKQLKASAVSGPKTNKMKNELTRLQINLPNATLSPDEKSSDDESSANNQTAVRRSRRGHVPLRNTWSHTLSDPFAYMRDLLENRPKNKSGLTQSVAMGASKRKRGQREDEHDSRTRGGRTLPTVHEHRELKITSRAKKRARIRDEEVAESAPVLETAPVPESAPVPEYAPVPELEAEEIAMQNESVPYDNQPKEHSFQLINWLRSISSKTHDTNAQVEEEYDSVTISPVSQLEFSNLGGIEYAFYSTEEICSFGYMRFQPFQERGLTQNKSNFLRFLVLYGKFKVESSSHKSLPLEEFVLNAGDMVEIKQGSRFNIINLVNEVGVLIVNRRPKSG